LVFGKEELKVERGGKVKVAIELNEVAKVVSLEGRIYKKRKCEYCKKERSGAFVTINMRRFRTEVWCKECSLSFIDKLVKVYKRKIFELFRNRSRDVINAIKDNVTRIVDKKTGEFLCYTVDVEGGIYSKDFGYIKGVVVSKVYDIIRMNIKDLKEDIEKLKYFKAKLEMNLVPNDRG